MKRRYQFGHVSVCDFAVAGVDRHHVVNARSLNNLLVRREMAKNFSGVCAIVSGRQWFDAIFFGMPFKLGIQKRLQRFNPWGFIIETADREAKRTVICKFENTASFHQQLLHGCSKEFFEFQRAGDLTLV